MDLRLLLTFTQFALIVLKLVGIVAWSWLLVLLPILLPLGISLVCWAAMAVIWLRMSRSEREAYQREERVKAILKAYRR